MNNSNWLRIVQLVRYRYLTLQKSISQLEDIYIEKCFVWLQTKVMFFPIHNQFSSCTKKII